MPCDLHGLGGVVTTNRKYALVTGQAPVPSLASMAAASCNRLFHTSHLPRSEGVSEKPQNRTPSSESRYSKFSLAEPQTTRSEGVREQSRGIASSLLRTGQRWGVAAVTVPT